MITSDVPATWQELQEETARILRECGFNVDIEKKVRTVRGEVEIDVFAEESVRGRKYVILCECKHWKARVPQAVIHAFRTTVSDIGANVGYVISTSGFQSGALSASELTNLQLASWQEFQAAFQESWLHEQFIPQLRARLSALMSYTDPAPLAPAWFGALSETEQDALVALREKHLPFGLLVLRLAWHSWSPQREPFPSLPLRQSLGDAEAISNIPTEVADSMAYRQLLDSLVHHGDAAVAEFRVFRDMAVGRTPGGGQGS